MRVKLVSVPVQDQQKALMFYSKILGFVKKVDVPMGENNRWLTVVAAEDQRSCWSLRQFILSPPKCIRRNSRRLAYRTPSFM